MKYGVVALFLVILVTFTLPAQLRHEVAPGETVFGIARQYGVSVATLTSANRIESPELLLPGTILTIPDGYIVRAGDTLFSIARRNDTTVAVLRELNRLDSSTIRVGQTLVLPRGTPDDAAAAETAGVAETQTPEEAPSEGVATPRDESRTTDGSVTAIPVAAAVIEPLSFAEGGAWPVAGSRRALDGKLPGVMIEAARGTDVVSVAAGRVIYSGPHSSFGNVIFVQSSQGYIYVYGGQEQVVVGVGDTVAAGQPLGTVGRTPGESIAGLYFSVWRDNQFVDPNAAPRG